MVLDRLSYGNAPIPDVPALLQSIMGPDGFGHVWDNWIGTRHRDSCSGSHSNGGTWGCRYPGGA